MARIRTIKPEFWTDEKIVQLPFEARLMFIGMWNFADDYGYLDDAPERLRLQVLPADAVDPYEVVDLLVASGLVEKTIVGEQSFLYIKGFEAHQKISHKTPTRFPVSSGKKQIIPSAVRRQVATRYGCEPGGRKAVTCFFCGAPGHIWWPTLNNGRPSGWIAFAEVELDHVDPEFKGGETKAENIVLSCRACNRSRGAKSITDFAVQKFPEISGAFRPEGKGMEGNGKEEDAWVSVRERVTDAFAKANSPNTPDTNYVAIWKSRGHDPEICVGIVSGMVAKKPSISTLKYFDQAIAEAHLAPVARARDGPPKRAAKENPYFDRLAGRKPYDEQQPSDPREPDSEHPDEAIGRQHRGAPTLEAKPASGRGGDVFDIEGLGAIGRGARRSG